ncbi:hypothetical protein M404DRAFT_389720 [Pisolithus tinctorius Marx 270]|uniref:Uncharacterized protein n=1 Tax=Pisolithus tinctorius Marx 270 TaxID=870435 RepID=A0A0C3KD97_PISTI|nr:hypothetical protein M404DRAFT_389720 [Pisolithus tinctorius Marx 270]
MKNGPTEDSPIESFWERGAERGPRDLQSPPHQPRIFPCLGIFLQLFDYFLLAVPELLELGIEGFTGSCLVQFPSCINQLFLHQMRFFFSFEACDNLLRGFRGFVELFVTSPTVNQRLPKFVPRCDTPLSARSTSFALSHKVDINRTRSAAPSPRTRANISRFLHIDLYIRLYVMP